MHKLNTQKSLLSLAIIMALSACGGGSGGSGGTQDNSAPGVTTSGRAVDGYLHGASVTCDANENSMVDGGEMTVITNASGVFTFSSACDNTLLAVGGIDTSTDYGFSGVLSAPAGSAYVTPLTTLLAQSALTNAQLVESLGLATGVDVTQVDPMKDASVHRVTLAVQQIVQQLANFLGSQTSHPYDGSQYVVAARALGNVLASNPSNTLFSSTGSVNLALLSAVVQEAAAEFGLSISQSEADTLASELGNEVVEFLLAGDSVLVATAVHLQNPYKPPLQHDHAKKNYLALENDSFRINDESFTLDQFRDGIAVPSLDTFEFEYFAQGHVDFDKVANFAFEVEEIGGKRVLQAKIENVSVERDATTGKLTVSSRENTVIYAYARDDKGVEYNVTIRDFTFDPLVEGNHSVTLNYSEVIDHVANHVQTPSGFDRDQFYNLQGQFKVKLVATNNVNVRLANGQPLSTINVGVNHTHYGVMGYGVEGKISIGSTMH